MIELSRKYFNRIIKIPRIILKHSRMMIKIVFKVGRKFRSDKIFEWHFWAHYKHFGISRIQSLIASYWDFSSLQFHNVIYCFQTQVSWCRTNEKLKTFFAEQWQGTTCDSYFFVSTQYTWFICLNFLITLLDAIFQVEPFLCIFW